MTLPQRRDLLFSAVVTIAILATYAAATFAVHPAGEIRRFAIVGARVVPIVGSPLENATVVVADGLVKEVGVHADTTDALIIQGKGLTVYPGLFDAFTNIGTVDETEQSTGSDKPARTRETVTGTEDHPASTPWRSAADEVNLHDERIATWREAGFTTAISVPQGRLFTGNAAILDLAGEHVGDPVVKSSVAHGIAFQPTGDSMSFPNSLMGVLAYFNQVWLDSRWFAKTQAIYERKPRGTERPSYDRALVVLAAALSKDTPVLIPANSEVQLRRALELADRWKVRAILYGGQMAYLLAPEIAKKNVPVLINVRWPEKGKGSDSGLESLRWLRFCHSAPSSPALLKQSGAKFAFYSGGIGQPKDIVKNVRASIASGLAPEDALRALTLTPAEIFGVSDRLGSIEPGKIANLLVTDGDLFDVKTTIKFVVVDGRRFEIRPAPN